MLRKSSKEQECVFLEMLSKVFGLQAIRYELSTVNYLLMGYILITLQEEPYKMSLFGKDPDYLEVAAADFLPDGNKLYILVADSDCNLHVLQYDPEGMENVTRCSLIMRTI